MSIVVTSVGLCLVAFFCVAFALSETFDAGLIDRVKPAASRQQVRAGFTFAVIALMVAFTAGALTR